MNHPRQPWGRVAVPILLQACAIVFAVTLMATVAPAVERFARAESLPEATGVDNGWTPTTLAAEDGAALVPGAGWTSFVWYGTGLVFNQEGPFTFSSDVPVTLRITDDFCGGDRFRVYDHGVEVGMTFDVVPVSSGGIGPDTAFADSRLASGIFALPAGDHAITIQVTDNPWGMGRAYLRVDEETPLGKFLLGEVRTVSGPVHGHDRFRFSAAWATDAGSDGVHPSLEDVVLWYGRYLEVIPAGAFTCDSTECVYESDGPGIQRFVIRASDVFVDADLVDLCPGSNPVTLGLWMGDDGAVRCVRCQGTLHD